MTLNRRMFLRTTMGGLLALKSLKLGSLAKERTEPAEIAITMDDPKPDSLAGMPGSEINRRILSTLAAARVQGALFVTGMRIDSAAGKTLIDEWDAAGHEICNHTYSHRSYNEPAVTYENFAGDFLKDEPLIHEYRHFNRRFR